MREIILSIQEIFGYEQQFIYPMIEILEEEMPTFEYHFLSNESFKKLKKEYFIDENLFIDISEKNKVYWEEILMRVQWGCFTSLMRTKRWLESIALNYKANNYIGFCSSLRGLIESSADSFYVFKATPYHLADIFGSIQAALNKKYENVFFQSKLFEDYLIHFTHGRKTNKNEDVPKSHKSKQIRQYIEQLDKSSNVTLYNLWKELCGLVHPSSDTVFMFCNGENLESGTKIKLDTKKDESLIDDLLKFNKGNLHIAFVSGVYPLLWTLKMLNLFEIQNLKCKSIEGISFNQWAKWKDMENNINYSEKQVNLKNENLIRRKR